MEFSIQHPDVIFPPIEAYPKKLKIFLRLLLGQLLGGFLPHLLSPVPGLLLLFNITRLLLTVAIDVTVTIFSIFTFFTALAILLLPLPVQSLWESEVQGRVPEQGISLVSGERQGP